MEVAENPFAKKSLEYINDMLTPRHEQGKFEFEFAQKTHNERLTTVPENFDGRDTWGSWIHPI